MNKENNIDFLKYANEVFTIESKAVNNIKLDNNFNKIIELIVNTKGKVVITGIGKSGHIGNKISSTLASTGTASFFVHPAEAAHGDLGMIDENDIVIAISYSGESEEIINILPTIKHKNIPIIAITSNPKSTLSSFAKFTISNKIEQEACPLGLAPTTSTTVTLAIGDAIAICLLKARNFNNNDFAIRHPAGTLGRKLLLTVDNIMHKDENIPYTYPNTSLYETILIISEKRLGFTAIVDENKKILGIFTDGDLRRLLQQKQNLEALTINLVMKKNPITINYKILAIDALNLMKENKITALLVVDDNDKLIGALNMHDILSAHII